MTSVGISPGGCAKLPRGARSVGPHGTLFHALNSAKTTRISLQRGISGQADGLTLAFDGLVLEGRVLRDNPSCG